MKLYRVSYYDDSTTGQGGFSWHTSRADAEQAASKYVRDRKPEPETGDYTNDLYRRRTGVERPEIEPVEFTTTKQGILRLLHVYASHPDNG